MKKYTIQEILDKNIAVWTKTKFVYDELMVNFEKKKRQWLSGSNPTMLNHWMVYRENTCIMIRDLGLAYGKRDTLVKNNQIIINPAQIDWNKTKTKNKKDFKFISLNNFSKIGITRENFVSFFKLSRDTEIIPTYVASLIFNWSRSNNITKGLSCDELASIILSNEEML